MEYLIRPCAPHDLGSLVALCGRHARYEKAEYTERGKAERLEAALFGSDPPVCCLVVEHSGKLIGYCSYTFDFSTWQAGPYLHLDCLFIDDGFRGASIGAELLTRVFAVAKERNCVNVQWQTPSFNEGAIRFYRRIGAVGLEKLRFTFDLKHALP